MNVPGVHRAYRTVRRWRKRSAARAVILMYHRVIELESDPWGLAVSPKHFAEHLEVIRQYGRPLSLQQLVKAHEERQIPDRAVVITFDDGYADNFLNARPILEFYDVPATVFITTGCVDEKREFWWDELDRLLLQPGTLPDQLCLEVNGRPYQWNLGKSVFYNADDFRRNRRQFAWNAKSGSRHGFYYTLWQLLQPLCRDERQKILEEVGIWAGADPIARLTHHTLSLAQLRMLAASELVEIGAHTVSHPFLSLHPLSAQRAEIEQSKRYLEDALDRPVAAFAYPHGDYTTYTISLLREAGYTCACTTAAESAWQGNSRLELPRFEVQNWNGKEFDRRLSVWFRS